MNRKEEIVKTSIKLRKMLMDDLKRHRKGKVSRKYALAVSRMSDLVIRTMIQ